MNTNTIGQRKMVALLFALGLLASLSTTAQAEYDALKDFKALMSGVIIEEMETETGNHIMKVEGDVRPPRTIRGAFTLVLEGHHDQPDSPLQSQQQSVQPECVPASGMGTFETKKGIVRFSQAGTVCLIVPGISNPATHLFFGTYYVTGGTGAYSKAYGSGSVSGSFNSDVSNPSGSGKRVILKFDGAINR